MPQIATTVLIFWTPPNGAEMEAMDYTYQIIKKRKSMRTCNNIRNKSNNYKRGTNLKDIVINRTKNLVAKSLSQVFFLDFL